MHTSNASSMVAFGGYACSFDFEGCDAETLLTFLFGDMMVDDASAHEQIAHYVLRETGNNGWQLSCDDESVKQYRTLNAVGNFLSGDVLFRLIEPNRHHLAFHAGLVSKTQGSVLLPAESGSGKTSVTAWLVSRCWRYHTDELVLINPQGKINQAFSRPLNIKSAGLEPVMQLANLTDITLEDSRIRQDQGITMMHQSVFNADCTVGPDTLLPDIRSIVFPHYDKSETPRLEKLSNAAAGLELMRSNVIARNLPGHGFGDIVKMVRNIPSYQLYYQSFDDLADIFNAVVASW